MTRPTARRSPGAGELPRLVRVGDEMGPAALEALASGDRSAGITLVEVG